MDKWQRIKHALGFHGKGNEWLAGRIFSDGRSGTYGIRAYYCPHCDLIYTEQDGDNGLGRLKITTLAEMRADRDADRAKWREELARFNVKKKQATVE